MQPFGRNENEWVTICYTEKTLLKLDIYIDVFWVNIEKMHVKLCSSKSKINRVALIIN